METMGAALGEFLEGVSGTPATLIANSMGGLVAELHAASVPGDVSHLVLVSPATPPVWGDRTINWQIARRLLAQGLPGVGTFYLENYRRKTDPARQVADALSIVCAHPERVPPEVVETSVQLAAIRRRMPWSVEALVRSSRGIGWVWSRREALVETVRSIKAPTLLLQGELDQIVTTNAVRWLASLRPDWIYRHMPDTAHCPHLDAVETFLAEVEPWLASRFNDGHEAAVG